VFHSASGMDALKIEEMEKMLKEAHLEKARLIESRVSRAICMQSLSTNNIDSQSCLIITVLFWPAGTRDSDP